MGGDDGGGGTGSEPGPGAVYLEDGLGAVPLCSAGGHPIGAGQGVAMAEEIIGKKWKLCELLDCGYLCSQNSWESNKLFVVHIAVNVLKATTEEPVRLIGSRTSATKRKYEGS